MGASAVWVDRPPKRHLRGLGDVVEDRTRPDLVEPGLDRLGSVEMANYGLVAVAGQTGPLFGGCFEVAPAHEHMFARAADRPAGLCQSSSSSSSSPRRRALPDHGHRPEMSGISIEPASPSSACTANTTSTITSAAAPNMTRPAIPASGTATSRASGL